MDSPEWRYHGITKQNAKPRITTEIFLQYCNQEINVSANKRTQTPRCMARILVTNIPIKWWQNLPGAVKRSHEVFGMDGEDGFITSLYRRESRRPQQGSLGHIYSVADFKTDAIVRLDSHWVPWNSNLFEILRVVYYYYYYYYYKLPVPRYRVLVVHSI